MTIGVPVELEGIARFPEGASLSFQPPAVDSAPVAALGASFGSSEPEGTLRRQSLRLTVAAFELGVVTLEPLAWTLRAADGSTTELKSPPVKFESVGPPGAQTPEADIRDIRGPLSAPWWLLVIPLALLAAAAWGLWRWRKSRRPEEGLEAEDDRRLPHERALDELNALYQAELPVKEFYSRLTDILRRYVEERFGVSASVLTTGDLMRQLREVELDRGLVARCREVFDHADLVKFARWVPAADEIRKDWSEAEHLVRETAPPPPEPKPAPGTARAGEAR